MKLLNRLKQQVFLNLIFISAKNQSLSRLQSGSTFKLPLNLFNRYPADIQRGVVLLEELYKKPDETGKRDYIFYLAIGNARLKVSFYVVKKFFIDNNSNDYFQKFFFNFNTYLQFSLFKGILLILSLSSQQIYYSVQLVTIRNKYQLMV